MWCRKKQRRGEGNAERERVGSHQSEYEIVRLEELVPQDHLLRKIDAAVDFSFIHDLCKDLYRPDNGRPAVEPEQLFKMLLWGTCMAFRQK